MKVLEKCNIMMCSSMVLVLGLLSACGTGDTVSKKQTLSKDYEQSVVKINENLTHSSKSTMVKIISAKYGETDVRQLIEQKYRLEPNLYYGEVGGPPAGEKGQVLIVRYSVNGKPRMLKCRKGYNLLISDELRLANAFKLLKVFAGKNDVTETFNKAVSRKEKYLKGGQLLPNKKGKIVLLCNDGSGRPAIREYRFEQIIPLSPFRSRNPRSFYVAKTAVANDKNPGTKELPWKTLKRATAFLIPGDELIIMPGIWKESLMPLCSGLPGKSIRYTGVKGKTILRGDIVLKNWSRDKNNNRVWIRKLHVTGIPQYPSNSHYSHLYSPRNLIDVTVDGQPLFWNKSSKLDAGCYYVDESTRNVYIRLADDGDPNQRRIEAIDKFAGVNFSRNLDALWPRTSYYSIENMHIKRFFFGGYAFGTNVVFSNNIMEWCARSGIIVDMASRHTYKNNTFRWMGAVGASFPGRSKVENNRMLFCNRYLHCPGWHSAGMKICNMPYSHSTFKNNEFAYSSALGFWFDTWITGSNVDGNIVHDNFNAGMEEEISFGNYWRNNISYRNRFGISIHNGNNSIYENNILYDNYRAGIEWLFVHVGDRKGTPEYIPLELERQTKRDALDTYPDYQKDVAALMKYYMPAKCSDNLFNRNLLIDNGTQLLLLEDWRYRQTGKIVEPIPELTANNKFKENVFIASSSRQAISGFSSVATWEKDNLNAENNVFATSMDNKNVPKWAKARFGKAKKYLDYPRKLNSKAVRKIRQELLINSPYECFKSGQTPAGLLAVARICGSPILEGKHFSDSMLKGYFIKYAGKRTLILWRQQSWSCPSDLAPLLLRNLPEGIKIETAWGEKLDIPRKGSLASIMVGTWPIYLVGCPKNIEEQIPFDFKYTKTKKMIKVRLINGVGDGKLIIDDNNEDCDSCPISVVMKNGEAEFKIIPGRKPNLANIKFRIAGHLDSLYSGGFFKITLLKNQGKKIKLDKIKMLPLKGNCDFSNIFNGKIGSLENMPKKIKLKNGALNFGKTCVGFKTTRLENGKNRPISFPINLGNRKIKKIVLALVGAWTGKETGKPLLAMNLFLDDNNVTSINLRNNLELRDWWTPPTANQLYKMNSNGSFKLWQGDCGQGHWVTVYAYVWENPTPDLAIRSIELKAMDSKASIGLLGVAIE